MPVLIVAAYDENGVPNAMNAAWGGIHDTNQIGVCLSAEHKTVKNMLSHKAFTVCIADAAHVVPCDYVGIVSGNYRIRTYLIAYLLSFGEYRILAVIAPVWTVRLDTFEIIPAQFLHSQRDLK